MENQSPLDPHIMQRLDELGAKYNLTGQSLLDNLEGLLHSKYLKYWEYIHLDTLLSLQNPRTQFPDEMIFIVYHQITELYFKIIIWEIDQIAAAEEVKPAFLLERMQRINRYFKHLSHSFEIMIDGMDIDQFRQFRMALLPASGFQSAQFRMIEIMATDFIRLVDQEK
ncbi:MAG TPA: tryptophan 2,3-dioxygenase, partial [Microscillaceae bacterium]|nr:tryptophan 2,3-dioxygenase [Microscillaceae bacterium]